MFKYFLSLFLMVSSVQLMAQEVIEMTTPLGAKEAFESFLKKDKFGPDDFGGIKKMKYNGIKNENLRSALTEKVNKIGEDFQQVSSEEIPTDRKYQRKIMFGLSTFNNIKSQLSQRDRQRVCQYIIELMDIIDLKSSAGQLMMFAYGFDPSTIKTDQKKK